MGKPEYFDQMTDAELEAKFDELAKIRNDCEFSMKRIRKEKEARRDREIDWLRAERGSHLPPPDGTCDSSDAITSD